MLEEYLLSAVQWLGPVCDRVLENWTILPFLIPNLTRSLKWTFRFLIMIIHHHGQESLISNLLFSLVYTILTLKAEKNIRNSTYKICI